MLLLLSFAFHDLKLCLSTQLKAASWARCSSEMPPSKQVNGHSFTTCLIVWGSPQSRHGPASVRNLFSRLLWPRSRYIPGSWMVGSLIKDLFGTSTVWFYHRVRQRSWMVRASSGRETISDVSISVVVGGESQCR